MTERCDLVHTPFAYRPAVLFRQIDIHVGVTFIAIHGGLQFVLVGKTPFADAAVGFRMRIGQRTFPTPSFIVLCGRVVLTHWNGSIGLAATLLGSLQRTHQGFLAVVILEVKVATVRCCGPLFSSSEAGTLRDMALIKENYYYQSREGIDLSSAPEACHGGNPIS